MWYKCMSNDHKIKKEQNEGVIVDVTTEQQHGHSESFYTSTYKEQKKI